VGVIAPRAPCQRVVASHNINLKGIGQRNCDFSQIVLPNAYCRIGPFDFGRDPLIFEIRRHPAMTDQANYEATLLRLNRALDQLREAPVAARLENDWTGAEQEEELAIMPDDRAPTGSGSRLQPWLGRQFWKKRNDEVLRRLDVVRAHVSAVLDAGRASTDNCRSKDGCACRLHSWKKLWRIACGDREEARLQGARALCGIENFFDAWKFWCNRRPAAQCDGGDGDC